MARLCYISRNYRGTDDAGSKAKTDNEDTLCEMGAVNLGLARSFHRSKVATFFIDLAGIMKFCLTIKRGDIILLQYPVKKYFSFICDVARMRGAKTMALIHDLGSFRRKKLTVEKEIGRLMHSDYVIASNETMRKWLTEKGYTNMTGALGLFDYRSSTVHSVPCAYRQGHAKLVYAGSLAMRKNAFILQLHDIIRSCQLHIYGKRDGMPMLKDSDNIVFHDFTPADEFIRSAEGDFGLVWDGDSADECTGDFGGYLRYNSPHKVSFYIRAGLPVIIWRKAALAEIVEKERIGICIDSLRQLEDVLCGITVDDYLAMLGNVTRVSENLRRGHYLSSAVGEAVKSLTTVSND